MNSEWLTTLKVGDEVAVSVRYHPLPDLTRITGETPKYWVVGAAKYRKDNGASLGGGTWDRSHMVQPTAELRERINHARLVKWLTRQEWAKYPLATLRAAKAALAPPPVEAPPTKPPTQCGSCRYEEADGELVEQCAKCRECDRNH